ncbi:MAG: LeuA family protein [Natronomonas sp.]
MRLCDVTLREAAQRPGREYSPDDRVTAGIALDELGVSLLQAGYPAAGEPDAETVRRLSASAAADIVAIARAVSDDVEAAAAADTDIVEVFVPISDVQLEHVYGDDRAAAFDAAEAALLRGREMGLDVRLTLMDAFRAEPSDIAAAFGRFDCPIVLSDAVGARTPPFVVGFLRTLAESGIDLDRAGVHFHDDLGCATANAIVAAQIGIDRIDASVAGIGERAGNPAIEELIVAAETRGEATGVDSDRLIPTCETVLDALDEPIDDRKAILGADAVTHEAGLHTDAMLSDPSTFESFDPSAFGGRRRLVFGSATGRGAARQLLERVDRSPTEADIDRLLERLEAEGPIELDAALELAEVV